MKTLGLGANSIRVISLCDSKWLFIKGLCYDSAYTGRSTTSTAFCGTI